MMFVLSLTIPFLASVNCLKETLVMRIMIVFEFFACPVLRD